jgi:hypothetical protein
LATPSRFPRPLPKHGFIVARLLLRLEKIPVF